ncbi:MAG: GGDEF domain-containing protein [bacterium]|nr:GGDEF domain-containing protein [bacterium]
MLTRGLRRTGKSRLPGRPRLAVLASVLVSFVLPSTDLRAQERGIRFDHITVEEGLTQNTVTCILQDRIGFMWFGTQDGLNRFDGNSFVAFRHDPAYPATLPNDYVQALEEDLSGDIWVGTRGGGLSRWNRASDSFTHFQHNPDDPTSLSSNLVSTLFQDSDGTLWVGTDRSGLNRLDPGSGRFERFRHEPSVSSSLSDDQVRAVLRDRDGHVWVATLKGANRLGSPELGNRSDGFERYLHDPGHPASLGHDSILSMLEDRSGNLWFAHYGGLDRLAPGTDSFDHFTHKPATGASLSPGRVRTLYQDVSDRLWIGTDGGVDLWLGDAQAFAHYRHSSEDSSSLSDDRVVSIFQDRGGVLWVGTQRGVNKWNPRTWTFSPYKGDPSRPSQLASSDVLSISQDSQGRLWIGHASHGLDRLDRATGSIRHFRHDPADPASLSGNRVTALHHDRRGVLWAGTLGNGLNRLDPGDESFIRYSHDPSRPDSLGANGVMAIFEDSRETLWIGTFGGGLNRLDRASGRFERFLHEAEQENSLSNDRVTAFAEDRRGNLWLGTFEGGLNRFDPDTKNFLRLRNDPAQASSLSSDMVFSLLSDSAGDLWVGTQIGLNRLLEIDEGGQAHFEHFLERDGLPNDVIYGIHPDAEGYLWLSTNSGLSRLDPGRRSFKNYNVSHGLQSNEFHMNAHFRSPGGELFFGGTGGFNAFFPDRLESNTAVPPVVLTSFSKLNKPVALGRPIFDLSDVSLSHRDSIVSFEFAALDYTAPRHNLYRYRLEGFNDSWIDLGNHRRVSFTNLDPGSYVLRVQGSNNDGVWNEDGLSIAIDVAPPPWKTWWAITLYTLSAAAAVWGFVSSQHRKVELERAIAQRERVQVKERERLIAEREKLIVELEEKNSELERFNYTVSHDLKSPLVTIKGFLGLLRKDIASGDGERVEHDIRRIGTAADRMSRLLDELLELSRVGRKINPPEEIALDELAAEAVEMVAGLVTERKGQIEIAEDLPTVVGDRGRLLEVFQNLLANAVTYVDESVRPRVEVGVRRNGADQIFFVRDNGIGIDPRYHEKVFGLFERLETEQDGTGIGLALVRRIVELHGGRIWVESEGSGSGSTFFFTLGREAAA